MRRTHLLLLMCILSAPLAAAEEKELFTVAEKSEYKATSRHADVVAFGEELVKHSKSIRIGSIGKSKENRDLPLWILSDPAIETPAQAAASGKPVYFAFANIHAGEVDGKEGLMALARDLLVKNDPILKKSVLLFVPIFNADGNERIAKTNRPEQVGPSEGVGIRANADGYDLNRDFIKLETPEVRALVKAIRDWNPGVVIDLHTTNGSYHRYPLTYDGPRNPNADAALILAAREKWLPEIGTRLEKASGYPSFFYGNFNRERTEWESYPPVPRYGIQYFAICNRIGLLSESYSYADYKTRVLASYWFTRSILEYSVDHRDEIDKRLKAAREPRGRIALRTKESALKGEVTVRGFVEEVKDGKRLPTRQPKDYTLKHVIGVETTLAIDRPYGYLVPAKYKLAAEALTNHGVEMKVLKRDLDAVEIEAAKVDKVSRADNPFQKHRTITLEVTRRKEKRPIPAGAFLIKTNQPLGNLAGVLLEPDTEDGLTTWNFFDDDLKEGKDHPVLRLLAKPGD